MATVRAEFPTVMCESFTDAFIKANEAAAYSKGNVSIGITYKQGTRRFVCTSLEGSFLTSLIQPVHPLSKKEMERYDPRKTATAPLILAIRISLRTISFTSRIISCPYPAQRQSSLANFCGEDPWDDAECVCSSLPRSHCLCITDGQHRIEALREAMQDRPGLADDAVAVSIVEEEGIDKTHQDFWDAAQTKALPVSMLVEFDGREPVNRVTRELVAGLSIFRDRVSRIAKTIGKKSVLMFTNSMIKNSVVMFAAGQQNEAAAGTYLRANTDILVAAHPGILRHLHGTQPAVEPGSRSVP